MDTVGKGVGSWAKRNRDRARTLLWDADAPGPLGTAFRVVVLTVWKFNAVDKGFLRASALTYSTLLSLVPLLALMFAVLKGFGVQRRLEPLLVKHIAMATRRWSARSLSTWTTPRSGPLGLLGSWPWCSLR